MISNLGILFKVFLLIYLAGSIIASLITVENCFNIFEWDEGLKLMYLGLLGSAFAGLIIAEINNFTDSQE